jgi:hypothetical protein
VAAVFVALAAVKQHEHDDRAWIERDREALLGNAEVRLQLHDFREVRRLSYRAMDDGESTQQNELGVRAVRLYALGAVRDRSFRTSRVGAATSECGFVIDPVDSYERFLAMAAHNAPNDQQLAAARWEVAATLPALAPRALAGLRRLDAEGALKYDAFALAALARLESERGNNDAATSAVLRCRGVTTDTGICEGNPAPSNPLLHAPGTLTLLALTLGLGAYAVAVLWALRANRLRARLGWFLWVEVLFATAAIMTPVLGTPRQPPVFGLVVAAAALVVMFAVLFLHWAAAHIAWPDPESGITFEAPDLVSDGRGLPVLARTTSIGTPWVMMTHRANTYRGNARQALGRVLPLPLAPLVVMSLLVIGGMYVTVGAGAYLATGNEETTRFVAAWPAWPLGDDSTREEGGPPTPPTPGFSEPAR